MWKCLLCDFEMEKPSKSFGKIKENAEKIANHVNEKSR